jgi:hypothetical protein
MSTTTRANVAVTAILQMICEALRRDPVLCAEIVERLCDEFDDIKREAATEIRPTDE